MQKSEKISKNTLFYFLTIIYDKILLSCHHYFLKLSIAWENIRIGILEINFEISLTWTTNCKSTWFLLKWHKLNKKDLVKISIEFSKSQVYCQVYWRWPGIFLNLCNNGWLPKNTVHLRQCSSEKRRDPSLHEEGKGGTREGEGGKWWKRKGTKSRGWGKRCMMRESLTPPPASPTRSSASRNSSDVTRTLVTPCRCLTGCCTTEIYYENRKKPARVPRCLWTKQMSPASKHLSTSDRSRIVSVSNVPKKFLICTCIIYSYMQMKS